MYVCIPDLIWAELHSMRFQENHWYWTSRLMEKYICSICNVFSRNSFSAVLLFRQFFTTSVTPIGMIRTSLYVVEFHLVQRCTNPFIPTFIESIGERCICPTKEALVVIWVKVREEYKLPIATVEKLVGDFNGKPTLVITILPRI